jgi:D-glycero-D-manno-heptose 1,7-bisphosphate phosphatase
MQKAVFVDRDGVLIRAPRINDKPHSIKKLEQLKILNGVNRGIKLIKKNFKIIMITNQPDVYRKRTTIRDVKKINNFLKKKLKLNDVYVCYHDNFHKCNCRKPKPGMLLLAKKKWNIDLKKSFLIGDRSSDIVAGKKVGCTNFFINYNYNEKLPDKKDCNYVKSFYKAALQINKITKKNEQN